MAKEHGKKKHMALSERKGLAGYLFLMPIIIGLVFIFLPAVVKSIIYSFYDVKMVFGGMEMSYVGFQNYIDAFLSDSSFITLLMGAVRGMFFDATVIILFSFFMSNVLNQKFVGRGFCRVVFFLPVVLSMGVVADLEEASEMFNAMTVAEEATAGGFDQLGFGTIFAVGNLVSLMGLPASMTDMVISVISNMYGILNASGVQILIFLSALQSISPSVFEAAKMEGATKWEEFWKITFPMLTPSLLVCVVYTVISTFTNPTYGVMEYLEGLSFTSGKYGYSAALSWIFSIIVLVVLGIAAGIISRRVTYLD